jgi:hypothetical protein
MLQHAARPTRRGQHASAETTPGGPARADKQSSLGNAAIAGRQGGGSSGSALENSEISSWLGDSEQIGGPQMASSDTSQPLRTDSARAGSWGALIGEADKVALHADADLKTESFSVPDGTSCEVSRTDDKSGNLFVEVRVGKEKKKGWVSGGVFSPQPDLNVDDDAPGFRDDFIYAQQSGDHSPVDPKGKDTAQGALGDCYFIASMAAVANASPNTIKDAIKYNKGDGTYTVRFFEESYGGQGKPVYITVDAFLPTVAGNRNDPAYAGEPGGKLWPAIMEKAYAKWKGGYDAIGGGGYGAQAMAELTGARSQQKSPSSMKVEEVIPYFEAAKKEGMAIYAAVENNRQSDAQTPFRGTGNKLSASITHTHRWNHIVPGSMRISDKEAKMRGTITDTGRENDHDAKLVGSPLSSGTVDYKKNTAELDLKEGMGPAKAEDLELQFKYQGAVNAEKLLVANHAYAFEGVVNGKELQFYNPWGTWQPKPITPAEFLKHFTNISTNKAPAGATTS